MLSFVEKVTTSLEPTHSLIPKFRKCFLFQLDPDVINMHIYTLLLMSSGPRDREKYCVKDSDEANREALEACAQVCNEGYLYCTRW